jgi:HKD family nuclease
VKTPKLPNADSKAIWRTLVGEGHAFAVGLPSDFTLTEVLKKAKKIQLATAFAHRSGWQHFRQGIAEGTASVSLLTGLEYCQTEPELLKEWLQLKASEANRVEAKVASKETFFHPKVLIVSYAGKHPDFAIVGSGNLSQGGLRDNTECCVYVQDGEFIKQLASWFEAEFSRDAAVQLTGPVITAYEPSYKRNRKRRKELEKEQRSAETKVLSVGRTLDWNLKRALSKAKKYFAGREFAEDYASHQKGAAQILKALKYPEFTFDKRGFDEFFSIGSFGRLNPLNRDKVFRSAARIRNGLRKLVADGEMVLPSVLNKGESLYVPGFRLNAVTKVLAAHDPKTWPAFNRRVQRALDDFGYPKPRAVGTAGQYLAYKKAMEKFVAVCKDEGCGDVNALALDAFFLHWTKYLDEKHRSRKQRH